MKLGNRADAAVQRRDLPDHIHAFGLALLQADFRELLLRTDACQPLGRHAKAT